jgi:hypothetical protein
MQIVFPDGDPSITLNGTLAFPVLIDGRVSQCEISYEALDRHFGAATHHIRDILLAYFGGRLRIRQAAVRKLPQATGACLLGPSDF